MTNYEKPIEAIRRILWAEDNPSSADASMTQDAAYEDLDAWLASELRAARAETWDEGVAAIHAWWNAPEDQRPSMIINPYGVGLQGDEPA